MFVLFIISPSTPYEFVALTKIQFFWKRLPRIDFIWLEIQKKQAGIFDNKDNRETKGRVWFWLYKGIVNKKKLFEKPKKE